MESLQCLPNWVVIRFDDSNEYVKLGSEKIKIDTSYEEERRAQVKGTIVQHCDRLFFKDQDPDSTAFNVPVEVQVGDEVLFHYNCTAVAKSQSRTWKEEGFTFMFVPYDQLYAVIRNDTIIPVNGWVFVEPIIEVQTAQGIVVPDNFAKKVSQKRGVVKYVGCKVRDYQMYPDQTDMDIDLQVGDEIEFPPSKAIPLHDSLQEKLKGLYRMNRIAISAIHLPA